MEHVPADAGEVRALFDCVELVVDPLVVERIIEMAASRAEIAEALRVDGRDPSRDPPPSSSRVAEIRALLAELLEDRQIGDNVTCVDERPASSGRT